MDRSPNFYEPIESPIDNPLHPQQTHNPVVTRFKTPEDKYGTPKDGFTVVLHDLPHDRTLSLLDRRTIR